MNGGKNYLHKTGYLRLDYVMGLRAFGLVIYGALPASLGALGAFKPPDQSVLDSKIGVAAFPYISCVALIPVLLTFVLVRQRLANWYLLPAYLNTRAVVITLGIILVSSIVVLANGLLVGTYELGSFAHWKALPWLEKIKPAMECLLLSFAYLVGSSTLFLTVVKEDGSLPLLPGKQEIENLASLRASLRAAISSPLYTTAPAAKNNQLKQQVDSITEATADARETLDKLSTGYIGLGRKEFYSNLSSELDRLREAAEDVGNAPANWEQYWLPGFDVSSRASDVRARRSSIDSLRGLAPHA
jgi:hypothetical protein